MLVSKADTDKVTDAMQKLAFEIDKAAGEAYILATEQCKVGSVEGVVAAFKMYERYRNDANKIGRLADFRKG